MGTSGLQQLLRNSQKRGTNWFVFLLVGVCLMLASNVSDAQLTVSCSISQTISCNAGTGEITVSASGGTGTYEYSIDGGTNWGPGNVFSGLAANSYTINVRDNDVTPATGSCSETLTQPDAISFSVSGSSLTCNGDATIDVTVAGGTPPYAVAVSGPTTPPSQLDNGSIFNFSDLNGGFYTISVTDANGCNAPAAPPYELLYDNSPPAISSLPDLEETSFASITSGTLTGVTINGPYVFSYSSTGGNDDIGAFNFSNYSSAGASFSFDIICTGTPSATDIIRILESNDGGGTFPITLATYTALNTGSYTGSITLDANPLLNQNVYIRISVEITTPGLVYDISNLLIKGNERVHTGSYSSSGPTYNDPNGASTDFIDSDVGWICSASGSEELSFIRNWRATDNCGNASGYTPQVIRVGTAPTFGAFPAAVTLDYCHNTGIAITAPVVSDNCTAVGNLVLEWRVFDSFGDPVSDWNSFASVTTYDFSPAPEEQNFQIGWRVTDEAGFSTESVTTQLISFRPEITISLVTTASPGNYDVCEGDNATFSLHGTGGTGGYNIISIDPSPTQALPITFSEGADATFTYNTTDHKITAGSSIVVTFQDRDYGSPTVIGGCPASEGTATFTSGGGVYTVHQKISTNGIGRD